LGNGNIVPIDQNKLFFDKNESFFGQNEAPMVQSGKHLVLYLSLSYGGGGGENNPFLDQSESFVGAGSPLINPKYPIPGQIKEVKGKQEHLVSIAGGR
jgi:hypothetical protein